MKEKMVQTQCGMVSISDLKKGKVFFLDEKDIEKFDVWFKKQKKVNYGAAGGGLIYKFTPTGLGMITEIEYNGKILDLTDIDNW